MRKTLVTFSFLFFSFSFLFLNPSKIQGFTIKQVDVIKSGEDSTLNIIPRSFCMMEGELFLIPDHHAGNIKIFEQKGKSLNLLKTFGRKGFGNDEFNNPAYCFYDMHESKFGVIDIGRGSKKLFIYDRIGPTDLKLANVVPKVEGYDMKLVGDGRQLIIAGYTTDKEGKSYELYALDVEKPEKKVFLLTSPQKYHLSDEEYRREYDRQAIPAIGIMSFIDIDGDNLYYLWECKLKIIKIDLRTGKRIGTFGRKAGTYREPVATETMIKSYRDSDSTGLQRERDRFSYIRDIFATPQYVIVIYEGPNESGINFRLQIYSPEGRLLGDRAIPGIPANSYQKIYFDKQSHKLYFLSTSRENTDHQILIYSVK
jgi:hypothetical protein